MKQEFYKPLWLIYGLNILCSFMIHWSVLGFLQCVLLTFSKTAVVLHRKRQPFNLQMIPF